MKLEGGKKNHRKLFNKAAAKALFCLAPVFKCKWFFLDLKIKIKLFPRQKFKKSNCLKKSSSINIPSSTVHAPEKKKVRGESGRSLGKLELLASRIPA